MVRRASSHHEFHRDVPECALAPGASFSVTFEKRGCRTMLQKHPHLRQAHLGDNRKPDGQRAF